jgi:hypothetical protein
MNPLRSLSVGAAHESRNLVQAELESEQKCSLALRNSLLVIARNGRLAANVTLYPKGRRRNSTEESPLLF